MTFVSPAKVALDFIQSSYIISIYNHTQATQARPGRPMKITGRQARPTKTSDRHRQAEDLRSLSWAGPGLILEACLDL
jgi:hypothetical protein